MPNLENDRDELYLNILGDRHMAAADFAAAADVWAILRQQYPDDAGGYQKGLDCLLTMRAFAEAERVALDAQRRFEGARWAMLGYGMALSGQQRWDEALACLTELCVAHPNWAMPFIKAADILRQLGRTDDLAAMITPVIDRFRDNLWIGATYAVLAHMQGQQDQALQRWRALRDSAPDQPVAWRGWIDALLAVGKKAAAGDAVGEAVRIFPNDPTFAKGLADIPGRNKGRGKQRGSKLRR